MAHTVRGTQTVTPHFRKAAVKAWRNDMRALRQDLKHVRQLRALEKPIWVSYQCHTDPFMQFLFEAVVPEGGYARKEDAEDVLDMLWGTHQSLRTRIRQINSWNVEAYSNLSPNAAAREKARKNRR